MNNFGVAPEIKEASKQAALGPLAQLLQNAGMTNEQASNIAMTAIRGKKEEPVIMPAPSKKGPLLLSLLGVSLIGLMFFLKRKK